MKDIKKRSIEIIFCGDAIKEGKISVSLFVGTVKYFQDAIYDIASSILQREPSKRGRRPSVIKRDCELFLVKTTTGSLHAVLELPAYQDEQYKLFPDWIDFSSNVIEETRILMNAFADGDANKIKDIIPDQIYRSRIVNKVKKFLPSEGSDYELAFRFSGSSPRQFTRPSSDKLIEIIGDRKTILEAEKSNIKIVDARGLVEIVDGDIKKWIEYYEVSEHDFDIDHVWRPRKIYHGNRIFHLRHPIACVIEREDDLFVTSDDLFNIITYGTTREEAIQNFSSEFSLLWDYIANDVDSNLTDDAKILKQKLLAIIKEVYISDAEKG